MRKTVLFLLLCMSMKVMKAQNFHVTGFIGASNYQGDMQDKVYTFDQAQFAWGLGLLYELSPHFFIRANATIGKISADDKKTSKPLVRLRNLRMSSSITDIHLGLEYDLFSLYENLITPYIFVGVSGYHFDPYTTDMAGKKTYLQPLGTEGQGFYLGRKKYQLNQLAIPFGGGVKFALSDDVRVGAEIGLRKLFTDYLDDVSTTYADQNSLRAFSGEKAVELAYRGDELPMGTGYPPLATLRGNPKSLDWYYFTGLTLSVRINPGDGRRSRGKGKYGCPSVN